MAGADIAGADIAGADIAGADIAGGSHVTQISRSKIKFILLLFIKSVV